MSAIWGTIDFNSTSASVGEQFDTYYHYYRIDRFAKKAIGNAEFGCCHQYITMESPSECLPIYDSSHQILYTADCVLDNREELLEYFPEYNSKTPDGQLLLAAYLKWGTHFGNYVLGAFSFVAYHKDTKTAVLCTDHMGNRSLFYTIQGNRVLFSTAIVPLSKVCNAPPSEKWLSGCLFSTSADMMVFEDLTPYENIVQLPAACIMKVTANGCKKITYWSPLKLRPNLYQPNDDAYRRLFVDTLSQSVSSMLRSSEESGCTLSSGLDSSSIAALAAKRLSKAQKDLLSYTSVPLPGFQEEKDPYQVVDESSGVMELCAMYPNIIPHFLPCEGQDAFSALPSLLPLIGFPIKSGQNLTWLNEIYRQASLAGCRLMLKGQYGNSTISYGPALGTIYQLLLSGHPIKAKNTAESFSLKYHVPRKKIVQFMFREWKGKWFPESYDARHALTAPKLSKKYKLLTLTNKDLKKSGGDQMDSRRQHLNFIINPVAQMQLGMFDTVMGLMHGMLIRDPSKDKRVVELCCRLPMECMLAGGMERGMVRTYMKGLVPEQILCDIHHRGVQSADYFYRCRLAWDEHRRKVLDALSICSLRHYVNNDLLETLTARLQTLPTDELTEDDLLQANVLYSCAIFLQSFS